MASQEKLSETKIKNEKGVELYCRYWNEDDKQDDSEVKALVFIVHGYMEHCLYYTELAEHIKKQAKGFYVFSHDHVGHGQSGGTKVVVHDFHEYVRDVFYHIEIVQKRFPNKPVFLIAHSMGGTVAVLAGLARPDFFKGLILIGPLITWPHENPIKVFFGKLAAKIIPSLPVGSLDGSHVSRDKEFVKKYEEDPLVYHGGATAGWAAAMLDAVAKLKGEMSTVKFPFLILHGTADKLCQPEGSQKLFDNAQSTDKQLKMMPESFHQPHNELPDVKTETLTMITQWLNERA